MIMENVPDFETAVETFQKTPFAATSYFILSGAGPWEGVVLTMDRLAKHLPDTPSPRRLSPQNWHIIQTNDDLNKPPHDLRRPIVEENLKYTSELQVSPEWMLGEMTSLP